MERVEWTRALYTMTREVECEMCLIPQRQKWMNEDRGVHLEVTCRKC